jgi:signal transduction histidine kinase
MLLLFTVVAVLLNIILGLFIYSKNPRSASHRIFFIFSLTNALWAFSNYLSINPPTNTTSLIWLRTHLCLSVFHAFVFVLLVNVFPKDRMIVNRKIWTFYTLFMASAMIASLSPFVFLNAVPVHQGVRAVPGPLMLLFASAAFGSIVVGFSLLIYKVHRSTGFYKAQLRYVLLGTACMFGLIFASIFIPVLISGDSRFTPLLPAYTFFFVGTTAYSIAKHRLFDIHILVVRSVVYSILLFIMAAVYSVGLFALSRYFLKEQVSVSQATTYATLALFIAFTYQPLKNAIEKISSRIFFKARYEDNDVLMTVTKMMASTLDLGTLNLQIILYLKDTLGISSATICISGTDLFITSTRDEREIKRQCVKYLPQLLDLSRLLLIEDEQQGPLRDLALQLQAAVILPLDTGNGRQGVLILGEKLSGEVYSDQDIRLLSIIGPEFAVALENASSYRQVSRFNATLKTEISKATHDLRHANTELSKKNEQLQELDKLKDEFISVTSHELRTPLTAIRGYLWMAMHSKKKEEGFGMYMDRAYISTERLITLVNDTLDVSRIESGRVELNPTPTNLAALASEVKDELLPRAAERHQRLLVASPKKVQAAMCDANKIRQVLVNLIGNALKFTPEKGTISIEFELEDDTVITRVCDTGPGLNAADQQKLFKKFSRIESTFSSVPGTGLGLYLCKQIIELSGGVIWIESHVGHGAKFCFSLPKTAQIPVVVTGLRSATAGVITTAPA